MAELTKKLNIKKGSATTACKIYSTTTEAGTSYVSTKVDNVAAYVPLVATSDGRASAGRITKSGSTQAIATTGKPPYNKIEYHTPGTYMFTVPVGVTTLQVEVAGAGGGGGGGGYYTGARDPIDRQSGKGGRGALINQKITVVSNEVVEITVGQGGSGGPWIEGDGSTICDSTLGGTGGNSKVKEVVAQGGTGGRLNGMYRPDQYTDGTSYGNGGEGGAGGRGKSNGASGANGWVIIEYGGDI